MYRDELRGGDWSASEKEKPPPDLRVGGRET